MSSKLKNTQKKIQRKLDRLRYIYENRLWADTYWPKGKSEFSVWIDKAEGLETISRPTLNADHNAHLWTACSDLINKLKVASQNNEKKSINDDHVKLERDDLKELTSSLASQVHSLLSQIRTLESKVKTTTQQRDEYMRLYFDLKSKRGNGELLKSIQPEEME